MHQSSGRWRLGLLLSLLTVFLWGILPIALAVTLQTLDVYTVTWFRFIVSFGLLAVYLGVRGKLPTLTQLRSASWKLLAIAIIFLASNYVLFLQGLALTSPANAEVIIQLAPVLLGFGGLVLFHLPAMLPNALRLLQKHRKQLKYLKHKKNNIPPCKKIEC